MTGSALTIARERSAFVPAGNSISVVAKEISAVEFADDRYKVLHQKFNSAETSATDSGFVFNEDTYAQAKPYFQIVVADLRVDVTEAKAMMRAIIRPLVANGLDRSALKGMKPYLVRFVKEMLSGQFVAHGSTETLVE
jgi:hypothetical protein